MIRWFLGNDIYIYLVSNNFRVQWKYFSWLKKIIINVNKHFQYKFNCWRELCIWQMLMHSRFTELTFEAHWYSDFIQISIIMGYHTTDHKWLLQSWHFTTYVQLNDLQLTIWYKLISNNWIYNRGHASQWIQFGFEIYYLKINF